MARTLLLLLLPAAILGPAFLVLRFLYRRHPGVPPSPRRVLQIYLVGFATSLPAALLETVLFVALLPAFAAEVPVPVVLALLAAGVGLIEEGMKLLFLNRMAIQQPDVRVPYDAVLFGVAVGMGFASVENRGYFLGVAAGGSDAALAIIVIGRLALSTPAHGLFGAIMGYYAGRAKVATDGRQRRRLRRRAYLEPAGWHGLFDFLVLWGERATLAVSVPIWGAFLLTVAAIWTIGVLLVRRARALSLPVAPVAAEATPPAIVAPLPPAPAADQDLSAWARPRRVS